MHEDYLPPFLVSLCLPWLGFVFLKRDMHIMLRLFLAFGLTCPYLEVLLFRLLHFRSCLERSPTYFWCHGLYFSVGHLSKWLVALIFVLLRSMPLLNFLSLNDLGKSTPIAKSNHIKFIHTNLIFLNRLRVISMFFTMASSRI